MLTRHLDDDMSNNHLSNLRYGTPAENCQDMFDHGRSYWLNREACVNGHPWTEENTYRLKGRRYCRPCGRKRYREYCARLQEKAAS
jgi:hypothetical protein